MLVNISHDTRREHVRLAVAGVVFLALVATLVGLSIAVYLKTFDRVTMITIKADRAGLQLPKYGDVSLHGAPVGLVRSVSQDGREAEIKVALEPDAASRIPANVTVEILPTTLFGQKFVSFVLPDDPSEESLADGDVIPSSRVETNVELQRVLAQLFPLLRTVQPAELNRTLNALATALDGRGTQLGETLDDLDSYLGTLQPQLPTLRRDLVLLAQVARTYDLAAPDLLGALRNLTVTSRTVIEKRQDLRTFFGDVTGLSDTATTLLDRNGAAIVKATDLTEPVVKLLATYSPEFPCLLAGIDRYTPILARVFEGNQIKQFVETGAAQNRGYDERDLPEFGEVGHGPWCLKLPNPVVPAGPQPLKDGTDIDDNPTSNPAPGSQPDNQRSRSVGRAVTSGYAGTPGDQFLANALLAGRSGRAADSYGALGSLLYGPVLRGGGR